MGACVHSGELLYNNLTQRSQAATEFRSKSDVFWCSLCLPSMSALAGFSGLEHWSGAVMHANLYDRVKHRTKTKFSAATSYKTLGESAMFLEQAALVMDGLSGAWPRDSMSC